MKTGQKVTVDQLLTTDPYDKRGESGEVVKIDGDIVTVKFSDGVTGMYLENVLILIS